MGSQEDIKVIKQFYAYLNQAELDSAIQLFDPDIVRDEFEQGSYRGLKEMRENLKGRENWAEGSCEPVEFFSEDHKIVVFAHVKVRLKNETKWIDAQVADGFSLKAGKISEFHSFINKEKAFQWAGITERS